MYRQSVKLVLLVIFVTSCGSGGYNNHGYAGSTAAFLPYVESVETVPAVVHAGEPYEVVARVSSQLNPDLLRGLPDRDWQPPDSWPWISDFASFGLSKTDPEQTVRVYNPWIVHPVLAGEMVDTLTLSSYTGSTAGTYTIRLHTAAIREWGGLESTYHMGSGYSVPEHPQAVYRDYEITVLPEEEGGE